MNLRTKEGVRRTTRDKSQEFIDDVNKTSPKCCVSHPFSFYAKRDFKFAQSLNLIKDYKNIQNKAQFYFFKDHGESFMAMDKVPCVKKFTYIQDEDPLYIKFLGTIRDNALLNSHHIYKSATFSRNMTDYLCYPKRPDTETS